VAEAAVIGVPHQKWGERPLAVVVRKAGDSVNEAELRDHLAAKFSKFCLPDGFVFVSEMPRTSTGKILKATLRERYRNWAEHAK
jgi:fatty-acyl-CoA synthase